MLKILAACHSGAPFQPGALRTCVPCLMVNPALLGGHLACLSVLDVAFFSLLDLDVGRGNLRGICSQRIEVLSVLR